MGIDGGLPAHICHEQLEPGDRLLLYTDGVTEARDAGSREFGLDRFTDFIIRRHADGLPVPETLRMLMNTILDYHDGRLRDDATVLFCEWRGPARNQRLTN
jgi:serine phosphatase RsbU (regulator of sigma subunit)